MFLFSSLKNNSFYKNFYKNIEKEKENKNQKENQKHNQDEEDVQKKENNTAELFAHDIFSFYKKSTMNIFFIFFLAFLDLKSKAFMMSFIPKGTTFAFNAYVDFVHWWNTGVSWSFFSNPQHLWILLILSAILCCTLLFFFLRSTHSLERFSFSLMIGGALGNMVDRYLHGAVFDFLYFHYGDYGFPAFNLADVFLTCGWLLYFYGFFKKKYPLLVVSSKKK